MDFQETLLVWVLPTVYEKYCFLTLTNTGYYKYTDTFSFADLMGENKKLYFFLNLAVNEVVHRFLKYV